jgi:hypothetical protein
VAFPVSTISRTTLDRPLLGRDNGPLSARTSSKGALVYETHAVLHALAVGATMEAVREDCLAGRLLKQRATETRRKIWNAIDWRLFAWNPPLWVQADLREAARGPAPDPGFIAMAYLHYARRDRLTFDFVTRHVWQIREGRQRLERSDVIEFLTEYEEQLKRAQPWRTTTRRKVAGNVLTVLRDFGLLSGVRWKTLQRPVPTLEVVLHLCRLLDAEGLRGRALLEALDWRLFLWGFEDVANALARLAQRGSIRYERSGRTVMLDIPRHAVQESA